MGFMSKQTPIPNNPAQPFFWTRRAMLQGVGLASAGAALGMPRRATAGPQASEIGLIFLDAEQLRDGLITEWPNSGSLAGAFTAGDDHRPRVATIGGRKAVLFDGKAWLRSSFPLPALLADDKPFTVMLWIFTERNSHHATLFTLGSRPKTCAEFNHNFGAANSSAAFNGFGPSIIGHREGQPPAGSWHHIAYCYSGGEKGRFELFLNGHLSGAKSLTVRSIAGQPLFLGSGFDTNNDKPHHPFIGAIAALQVLDHPLEAREVRNVIGKFTAFSPSPDHLAVVSDQSIILRWHIGRQGALPSLTMADTEAALAEAGPLPAEQVRIDPATGQCEYGPFDVPIGRRMFWRVDQLHEGRMERGELWEFAISTGPATQPVPRDRLTGVACQTRKLNWQPGPYATAQEVFFGDTADLVARGVHSLGRLDGMTNHLQTSLSLLPGKTYFWRVASANGDHAADPGTIWSFRTEDTPIKNDVTFFVATDQHYGKGDSGEINRSVIGLINSLAGTAYPANNGGVVRTPRGVVAPGDLLDKGYDPKDARQKWDEWVADFGLTGLEGHLAFPVYEGIGNHDGGPAFSIPRQQIRERNKIRPGLTEVSENGLHYSWDWDHIHLVQVNLFPGDGPEDVMNVNPVSHDPEMALDFLKKDLAKHVGDSGKPVIILQHYGILGGMSDWWTPEAKERYFQAIDKYNVIGIFNGHSHGADFILWHDLLTVHCGTTARPEYGTGDFMVVHVTETEMKVIHRKSDSWGISRSIPIRTPAAFKA